MTMNPSNPEEPETFLYGYFTAHCSVKLRGSRDAEKWIASLKALPFGLDEIVTDLRQYEKEGDPGQGLNETVTIDRKELEEMHRMIEAMMKRVDSLIARLGAGSSHPAQTSSPEAPSS